MILILTWNGRTQYIINVYKKNLKIPKGSESVNRRKTDNTMATKKRTNHNLQNITQKTKDRATRTPLKTSGVAKPSA
jgi:hypothetical protein